MNKFTIIKHDRQGMKQYALTDPKVKGLLIAGLSTGLTLVLALGIFIGSLFTGKQKDFDKIATLQSRVEQSQVALDEYKSMVQNDLDSMSLQVGRLMAQSTRLNALGNRLTEVNNINSEEFNLDIQPGIGGADLQLTGEDNTPQDLYQNLFSLENSFIKQQEKLNILTQLLNQESSNHLSTPHSKPLKGGWISSRYGKRIDPFTGQKASHSGMDFSGKYDAEITAAAEGIVVWAGKRGNYGNMVEIDHGNGYTTRYAHAKTLNVSLGQRVEAGDLIAIMGKSGRATSEHLHFEVLKNGHKVNPLPFIQS
ncbi:M23 family metallopeptidase [Marinicella rhabdoformis]|uniref:M23 family metallopeptidase n=1 Tax=Marinicella rhabdoformis TaxID=2580566 RepID=UPI0012AECBB0|nr:M23 family metallopeptidase [Marinicella rhabdoformis]